MDVSIWWVWIGATVGVCAGIGLFAVLSMSADRDGEEFGDAHVPTETSV
jgi:hypothetical protein